MKKYIGIALLFGVFATSGVYAQVGMNTNTPNKDAVLDLNTGGSNTEGLLLPKVALTAINSPSPMSAHVAGMKVYNTATAGTGVNGVSPGVYINDGSKWVRSETGTVWFLNGNAGTNATTNFVGTTDVKDLVIEANNAEKMRVASTGQVLIGTNTVPTGGANAKVILDNGTTAGAIQIKDGTQADGATLISDANGVASWFQGGNTDLGTGIYTCSVAQTFPIGGVYTTLQTSKPIKISAPGNYFVSVRWWGNTEGTNSNAQVEADFSLRKNGVEVDVLQQYATKYQADINNRICFTTNLIAINCIANDVLTIAVRPGGVNFGGYWYTGQAGTNSTWMPSVMVVKM